MGTRGPQPEPTALKLLKGNPGKRAVNTSEPKPAAKLPKCPDHLDEVARKEWKRLAPILSRMRVLTEADYITLAALCQTYSQWKAAQEQLNRAGVAGMLYKGPTGYIQVSPMLTIARAAVDQLTKLCREFGLTPSSRSGIQVADGRAKPADPWEKFA